MPMAARRKIVVNGQGLGFFAREQKSREVQTDETRAADQNVRFVKIHNPLRSEAIAEHLSQSAEHQRKTGQLQSERIFDALFAQGLTVNPRQMGDRQLSDSALFSPQLNHHFGDTKPRLRSQRDIRQRIAADQLESRVDVAQRNKKQGL